MPQLFVIAAAAAAAYAGWRLLKREMARVERRLDAARDRSEAAAPTLERDPATGVYRPRENA
jgi:hypothetical protein